MSWASRSWTFIKQKVKRDHEWLWFPHSLIALPLFGLSKPWYFHHIWYNSNELKMLKTYSLSLAQSEFPLLTFKIFTAVLPEVSYHMHKLVQEQSWIAFPVPSLPLFWDFISSLCIPFLVGFCSQGALWCYQLPYSFTALIKALMQSTVELLCTLVPSPQILLDVFLHHRALRWFEVQFRWGHWDLTLVEWSSVLVQGNPVYTIYHCEDQFWPYSAGGWSTKCQGQEEKWQLAKFLEKGFQVCSSIYAYYV